MNFLERMAQSPRNIFNQVNPWDDGKTLRQPLSRTERQMNEVDALIPQGKWSGDMQVPTASIRPRAMPVVSRPQPIIPRVSVVNGLPNLQGSYNGTLVQGYVDPAPSRPLQARYSQVQPYTPAGSLQFSQGDGINSTGNPEDLFNLLRHPKRRWPGGFI